MRTAARGIVRRTTPCKGARIRQVGEPAAAEPDVLRDAVYEALSSLSVNERSNVRTTLLAELETAGLGVCQCLFMLGVSALTPDELTAPEIASLIRYVRLTEPNAMKAVAEPLRQLLTVNACEVGASAWAALFGIRMQDSAGEAKPALMGHGRTTAAQSMVATGEWNSHHNGSQDP
jgi:hypothetical protein